MRVLVVDLCYEKESLHKLEFVRPILDILSKVDACVEVLHFSEIGSVLGFDKIILCGTALKDFRYLDSISSFSFLEDFKGDILGICAGAQVLGLVFGCSLKDRQQIGLIDLEIIENDLLFDDVLFSEVYSLHNKEVVLNDRFKVLARCDRSPQVFKLKDDKRDVYGVLFHPEVRNKRLVENFVFVRG